MVFMPPQRRRRRARTPSGRSTRSGTSPARWGRGRCPPGRRRGRRAAARDVGRRGLRRIDAGEHVGVDAGRVDAVDGDPARRQYRSQCLGERVRGRLGGRIAGHRRGAREAEQREQVDHVAVAVSLERGDERADRRVGAFVVDGDLTAHGCRVGVERAGERGRRGVVDQQRGVAATGGRGVDGGRVGEVERGRDDARVRANRHRVARERIRPSGRRG